MKIRVLTYVSAGAAALALSACSQQAETTVPAEDIAAQEVQDDTMAAPDAGATAETRAADATQFLNQALLADNSEVEAGTLAAEKGSSQAVKDFGRMLAKDHGAHRAKVLATGKDMGVADTKDTTPEAKALMARLKPLSGAEFDRAFAQGMVDSHRRSIAMYEQQENAAGPEPVKALVRETLPVLRKHLQTAESLNK